MVFVETTSQCWRVQVDADDYKRRGFVERQEYTRTLKGKRSQQVVWFARSNGTGWKSCGLVKFNTRREAGEFVLAQSKVPYQQKRVAPSRLAKLNAAR